MSDIAPLGYPYLIGEAMSDAIQASPELAGCVLINNPSKPSELSKGARLIVLKDARDIERFDNGNAAGRTFQFTAGAIARTENDPRKQAHTDYRALKRVLRAAITEMVRVQKVNVTGLIKERDVTFDLENIDVGGALVLGTFTVDYRDNSF